MVNVVFKAYCQFLIFYISAGKQYRLSIKAVLFCLVIPFIKCSTMVILKSFVSEKEVSSIEWLLVIRNHCGTF